MATFTSGELAGIIAGSMVGTLFLVTCIISAVKAVKDRRQIKARIQERKRAHVLASKLKREGRLGDDNAALSIEDPDYFSRNGLNANRSNDHRVVGQSNSCPTNDDRNGGLPDPEPGCVTHTQVKRHSEPAYSSNANNSNSYGYGPASRGGRRGRQQPSNLMSIGVYRYKGEHSNGVENAAFEMKETGALRNTSSAVRY